ncbi:MAG: LacI family DNA-binding transcriptional regulator [Hyphomicrobiales bacterium]
MPTMKDVARLANVSVATVSAVISGKKYVSPELKERVQQTISELKYRPSVVASQLKLGRTSLIGLIIPDISNPFYTDIVANVQASAREENLTVILGISDQDPQREKEMIEFMSSQHAEVLIICSCGYGGETAEVLNNASHTMNLVLVDAIPDRVNADTITLDNFTAGRLATEHAISFGHRDIAIVTGPPSATSSEDRLNGYTHAMEAAGLRPNPRHQHNGAFRIGEGYEAATTLLEEVAKPSAIFVCNNLMLIGVMRAISDKELDVPGDISIVSIDDFPWASAFSPAITTVRQPTAEMGRAAFELAKDRLGKNDVPTVHKVFAPELITRGSCTTAKLKN